MLLLSRCDKVRCRGFCQSTPGTGKFAVDGAGIDFASMVDGMVAIWITPQGGGWSSFFALAWRKKDHPF